MAGDEMTEGGQKEAEKKIHRRRVHCIEMSQNVHKVKCSCPRAPRAGPPPRNKRPHGRSDVAERLKVKWRSRRTGPEAA